MSLTIYFTKPVDTAIAGENATFIRALEQTAGAMPGVRVANRPDIADIVLIDERYQYRTWRYADELSQCEFVRRHAERICVINHDSYARVFLPGLYVSLEKSRPSFVPALPIPYKWDLWQVPVPRAFDFQPQRLFTFRGTFHTHPVRKRICRIMSQTKDGTCEELRKAFHSHDDHDQQRYIEEIRGARFSLCPRGLSPSTYRLYESMQLGRCPIVISDDWVAPAGPDWEQFSIFVAESEVQRLPDLLVREADRAETLGRRAFRAWEEFFSWPRRWRYLLELVVAIQQEQGQRKGYMDLCELWRGSAFLQRYQWTLSGRMKQFLSRKYRALTERNLPEVKL